MTTFILAFLVIVLAVAALALGVLLGRRPLGGSCGGLGCAGCAGCPSRSRNDRAS